jgi:hypothetical protein
MRKRVWIPLAAVIVACLLLLLRSAQHQRTALVEPTEALTNQSRAPERPKSASGQVPTAPAREPMVAPAVPPAATPAGSNSVNGPLLAAWQTPIEFYGKVIDENGNTVAGAKISFHWVETPAENGNRGTNTESDAEGLFSLTGQRGPDLSVSISKEGYYGTRGSAKYGPFGNPEFSPDPRNPVVFTLKKKGSPEPLLALKRNYAVSRGGKPLSIDLVTGATTAGETGNLVVQCWTDDHGKRSGEKYDWRCIVTIPGNGLTQTDDQFPFLAPENGYTPSVEINMPSDRADWKSDVDLKFYYQLADGRYGRMTFSMIAGGHHFCMIDSFLNPTGSRNLEPLETPPAATPPAWLPPGVKAVVPEFK